MMKLCDEKTGNHVQIREIKFALNEKGILHFHINGGVYVNDVDISFARKIRDKILGEKK